MPQQRGQGYRDQGKATDSNKIVGNPYRDETFGEVQNHHGYPKRPTACFPGVSRTWISISYLAYIKVSNQAGQNPGKRNRPQEKTNRRVNQGQKCIAHSE